MAIDRGFTLVELLVVTTPAERPRLKLEVMQLRDTKDKLSKDE
jgi:hypothetical protein